METEALRDALADTLAKIELENFLRERRLSGGRGTSQNDASQPSRG